MPVLALLLQAAQPTPAPPVPWAVTQENGADGRRSASASTTEPGGARLAIRCDRVTDPVVSIQFLPRARLRRFGVQPVTLQVDGATPLTDNWEMIGGGAIERLDAAVTTLAAAIARGRQIKLRSLDAAGSVIDLTFAGPGGDTGVRQVLAACGYTLGQLPARTNPPAAAARAPTP